jgi:hypothetical protein
MTRADWIAVTLALALLPALYAGLWQVGGPGQSVEIWTPDHKPMILPLDQERTVHVHGPLGNSVIEIHDGKARFLSSPCAAKTCIHAGWQSRGGETAACLPNRVSIEILGGKQRYDSINF